MANKIQTPDESGLQVNRGTGKYEETLMALNKSELQLYRENKDPPRKAQMVQTSCREMRGIGGTPSPELIEQIKGSPVQIYQPFLAK